MSKRQNSRGFTLIEMAVVLGIIALIMGFALSLGDNAVSSAERVSTMQKMKTIQSALESFVKMNGYLPCPTSRSATVDFGLENRNSGNAANPCTLPTGIVRANSTSGLGNGYIGAVPVTTLGLPISLAADAWHNKFTYVVSTPQAAGPGSYAIATPSINVWFGDRTGTHYKLTEPNSTGTHVPGYGATYVLISHGPDGKGAYGINDTAPAVPCGTSNANDVANCDDADLDFYDDDYNDGKQVNQFFDDYVIWGSNTLVATPNSTVSLTGTGCSGACEAWCAPCMPNAMIPNSNLPTDWVNIANPVLCKKVITSTAPCSATCFWSGTVINETPNTYARCP